MIEGFEANYNHIATTCCGHYSSKLRGVDIGKHIKKFAEIWLQLHQFVHYKLHSFYCIDTLYSHIFSLKTQISDHKYHEKEQLLANRIVPHEPQYTKTPLVIFTLKEHNHLQNISNGHLDHFHAMGILTNLTNSFMSCDTF